MVTVAVIVGSTRQGRFGDKPARWIAEKLEAHPDIAVELLDLVDFALPFFDEPASPAFRSGVPIADPAVRAWSEAIARADAFVIVTAEYNHGYPAVLKNALDHLYAEWSRKPVAFVGYGNAGGARAIEQLRQVAIELEMAPIKRSVAVPLEALKQFHFEQTEDLDFSLADVAAEAMIAELLWWASALKPARVEAVVA